MVKVFVEGGGEGQNRVMCRRAFQNFFRTAGLRGRPTVIPCGSRHTAREKYCDAIKSGEDALLLVDSESPVGSECQSGKSESWNPWLHLKKEGDVWKRPRGGRNVDCHLMVEVMENWMLSDPDGARRYYGDKFKAKALGNVDMPESISKADAIKRLKNASRACRGKGEYKKGRHSFELLGMIDSLKVIEKCPWAERLVCELNRRDL